MKATMETYEIRTVADFLRVPPSRRGVCLREFHVWLDLQELMLSLLEKAGCPPGSVVSKNEVYRWEDDGKRTATVTLDAE